MHECVSNCVCIIPHILMRVFICTCAPTHALVGYVLRIHSPLFVPCLCCIHDSFMHAWRLLAVCCGAGASHMPLRREKPQSQGLLRVWGLGKVQAIKGLGILVNAVICNMQTLCMINDSRTCSAILGNFWGQPSHCNQQGVVHDIVASGISRFGILRTKLMISKPCPVE